MEFAYADFIPDSPGTKRWSSSMLKYAIYFVSIVLIVIGICSYAQWRYRCNQFRKRFKGDLVDLLYHLDRCRPDHHRAPPLAQSPLPDPPQDMPFTEVISDSPIHSDISEEEDSESWPI